MGPPAGPVLCFAHGVGAAMEQFEPQVDHSSRRYRVLRLSPRGHGRSGEPPTAEPGAYTPRALAEDLRALAEYLGIVELRFVGNSLGDLVGYELLKAGPPRLRSLTTFGTTAELRSSRTKYWMVVGSIRLFGMLFGNNAMASLREKTGSRDREVGMILKRMLLCARQDALKMLTRSIANYDYTPVLSAIDVPVLLDPPHRQFVFTMPKAPRPVEMEPALPAVRGGWRFRRAGGVRLRTVFGFCSDPA